MPQMEVGPPILRALHLRGGVIGSTPDSGSGSWGSSPCPAASTVRVKWLSIVLALVLGAGIAACGGDDSSSGEVAATSTPTPAANPANVNEIAAGITKNTQKEPKIVTPTGDPPSKLVVKDIVK